MSDQKFDELHGFLMVVIALISLLFLGTASECGRAQGQADTQRQWLKSLTEVEAGKE
jgi:hypothetical protein